MTNTHKDLFNNAKLYINAINDDPNENNKSEIALYTLSRRIIEFCK